MTADQSNSTVEVLQLTDEAEGLLLTLNRPAKLNAINPGLLQEIAAAIDLASTRQSVRALLIRGAGQRAFSAGADLAYLQRADREAKKAYIETAYQTFERLAVLPIPTIAMLHGYVLGGGLELALACDLRIAQRDVVLGMPELQLNSVPSFGAVQRLEKLIGYSQAIRLLMLSEKIPGEEALKIGLIHKVTSSTALYETAMDVAIDLSRRNTQAVRYLKTALRSTRIDPNLAATMHALMSCDLHLSKDYQQATGTFRSA